MRRVLFVPMLVALFGCATAAAQMVDTVPGIGMTTPLGITVDTPVAPTGNPMGATELPSVGLSPLPTCSGTTGTSSGMPGAGTTYDGGGMTMGMQLPGSTATSGTCDASSTASASSPTVLSTPSPGGASRAGIPLGSVEISNGGLSAMPVAPAPSQYQPAMPTLGLNPAITPAPSLSQSSTPSTSQFPFTALPTNPNPSTIATGVSCGALGSSTAFNGC
jgi:hypothetical protein